MGENGHPLLQQSGWCFVRRRSPLGVGDEVLSETDRVLAVSELLCHPLGHVKHTRGADRN